MRKFLMLLASAILLTTGSMVLSSPAQAADEWIDSEPGVITGATQCRGVDSSVPGASARFTICWNDALTNVYVHAVAADTAADGMHAEARIRYQVNTSGTWSSFHFRAPAVDTQPDGIPVSGHWFKARFLTRNVQAAACVYDVDKLVNCDDRGWQ